MPTDEEHAKLQQILTDLESITINQKTIELFHCLNDIINETLKRIDGSHKIITSN